MALRVAVQSLLDFLIGSHHPPPIQTDISQRIGWLMSWPSLSGAHTRILCDAML